MVRIHAFEFEDLDWFPSVWRDGGTDFLGFVLRLVRYYEPIAPILRNALLQSGKNRVFDMASGSGGPVEMICERAAVDADTAFVLSDKYPNRPAYEALRSRYPGSIDYHPNPVDVLDMPADIDGFRTMFSAIHHFRPADVSTILSQAVDHGAPIGLFDSGDKNLLTILGILCIHPILFFTCTPFLHPFKWSRILFTYFIPIIPLFTIWDGVVSILRLYKSRELADIARQVDTRQEFQWTHGKVKSPLGFSVSYLIGIPI